MPISPSPGKGISTAGLNKTSGWGSRDAAGGIIPNHGADQGIAHVEGLSEGGLDTSTAPYAYEVAPTGITGTGAVVNWGTAPACPAGSVKFRLAGSGGAFTTVAEAAGTRTTHSVPLTGLVAGKTYEYTVTQPSWTAGGLPIEFSGRVHTTGGTQEEPEGMQGLMQERLGAPILNDTTGITDSQDLLQNGSPQPPAFDMNNLKTVANNPNEVTVTWRTAVYADGTVMYRPVGGQATTVDELGVKRLNHSVTLTGLAPDTEYEVAVISADAQGNTVEAGPTRVHTPA